MFVQHESRLLNADRWQHLPREAFKGASYALMAAWAVAEITKKETEDPTPRMAA